MERERERRHLAAASAHLHLPAAAHYMAEARAPRLDVELDHGGLGAALGHGENVGELGHGGHVWGFDWGTDLQELEWTMQDLYDFPLLLASFVPPAPTYKALPQNVVEGLAWTWIVLAYGVFLAVVVTAFSVRVLGTSTRCLPTLLRGLLLTATVVSEVFGGYLHDAPTTLTVVGTCFTLVFLLAAHLIACRRSR